MTGQAQAGTVLTLPTATTASCGEAGGDRWPDWARAQLQAAVAVAGGASAATTVATLHRDWFARRLDGATLLRSPRPLAGVYRAAHAGAGVRGASVPLGDPAVCGRHDVIGADGWWRTWGESWTPPRARPYPVRILLSPQPGRLAAFVGIVTAALIDSPAPWMLACATRPARVRRAGAAVLQLPDLDALPADLLDRLAALLHPTTTPLAAPLVPGAGLTVAPTNGMTFGEHRCHLLALGLRQPAARRDPLGAIASVFAAHGVRPATPWRTR